MLRRWGRAQEAEHVAKRSGDQQDRCPTIPVVPQPIGKAARYGGQQIMPQTVVLRARVQRTGQIQSDEAGEDRDGDPVVNGFHILGVPCLSRRYHWHKIIPPALAGTAGLLLSACHPAEPSGQVIADVDGVEITLAELNDEARARNLPIRTDRAQRDAALADLVTRKLLVRAARARGLDRTPEYVLGERRMREILLAQQIVVARIAESAPATEQQVQQLLAAPPNSPGPSRLQLSEQRPLALALLERRRAEEAVAQILSSERPIVTVRYQRGFAPGHSGK